MILFPFLPFLFGVFWLLFLGFSGEFYDSFSVYLSVYPLSHLFVSCDLTIWNFITFNL